MQGEAYEAGEAMITDITAEAEDYRRGPGLLYCGKCRPKPILPRKDLFQADRHPAVRLRQRAARENSRKPTEAPREKWRGLETPGLYRPLLMNWTFEQTTAKPADRNRPLLESWGNHARLKISATCLGRRGGREKNYLAAATNTHGKRVAVCMFLYWVTLQL